VRGAVDVGHDQRADVLGVDVGNVERTGEAIALDKGDNVGVYAKKDKLRMSGLVWDEAQTALSQKAFLINQAWEAGKVIAFAEEPNYRAYTEGAMLLFANAVLLGPAF